MTIATVEKKLDALIVLLKERLPVPVPAVQVERDFFATFPTLGPLRTAVGDGESDDHLWWVEGKEPNRVTVVSGGRDGPTALRLHTEPGDSAVSGSKLHERADVALRGKYEMYEGWEGCLAHSILFPDDYAIPPMGHWGLVFNFHDTRDQGGQANVQLFVGPGGRMILKGFAGPKVIDDAAFPNYEADFGVLIRGIWYDFVYNVRWSATDGFFRAWVGGKKKLDYKGPTLYKDYGVYLKLANYHSAFGKPSSVIHDRVCRGKTAASVSLTTLE